jgi:hypothetical protein
MAAWENHCGDIKRIRTWVNGSDTYGVWVEFTANPPSCAGGLYLPQTGNNRDMVYSTALSAKMANQKICFQFNNSPESKISNRCRVNYIYHP